MKNARIMYVDNPHTHQQYEWLVNPSAIDLMIAPLEYFKSHIKKDVYIINFKWGSKTKSKRIEVDSIEALKGKWCEYYAAMRSFKIDIGGSRYIFNLDNFESINRPMVRDGAFEDGDKWHIEVRFISGNVQRFILKDKEEAFDVYDAFKEALFDVNNIKRKDSDLIQEALS